MPNDSNRNEALRLHTDLQKLFDNRVSFRKLERKLYGHDIAAMPGLVKSLEEMDVVAIGCPDRRDL